MRGKMVLTNNYGRADVNLPGRLLDVKRVSSELLWFFGVGGASDAH